MEKKKTGGLSFITKVAYGCGDAACNVVYGMIATLLTLFYTDYVGVSIATVGLVMLISRVFDGVSDVAMGFVTERVKSKWGKFRPWLLWMAVPYGITAVALFTVPQTNATLQFWYIFVTYNLCTTIVYTAINVPYGALSARMTRSSNERSLLSIFRLVLARIGQIITVMFTMPLVKLFGDTQSAWIKAISIWAVLAVALLLFNFVKCEETIKIEETVEKVKIPLSKNLKALFTNGYFWATLLLLAITNIHTTVVGTILPYYCKYIFNNDGWMYSMMYFAEIGTVVIVAMLCPLLLRHFTKRKLLLISTVIVLVAQLLYMVNPFNYQWMLLTIILRGAGIAPLNAVMFGMIGDAVEYGQWKNHFRQESLIFACGSMGFKIGNGLASAGLSIMLTLSGYVSSTTGGAVQSGSAINTIRQIYTWAPIVIWGAAFIIMLFYRLEKQYPQIMKELKEREAKGTY